MVLILKAVFLALASVSSVAQPLDQDSHLRFLASYNGYYRISLDVRTIKSMDQVRFIVCKDEKCEDFPEPVSFEKIDSFKEPLLASLREYRNELETRKSGFFASISGSVGKKKDLAAMNKIIADIEKDGLQNWILLSKQNIQQDATDFGTYEGAEGFYDRLQSTLLKTKLPSPEIKQIEHATRKLKTSTDHPCK